MNLRQALAFLFLAGSMAYAADVPATITSDQLELDKNGETTIFSGHVILTQTPYEVRSNRMTRRKSTGNVFAHGNVVGTWVSAKNERVRIESDEALYKPIAQTIELWGKKQVAVHLFQKHDEAHFQGDRGWVYTQTPGKARLVGRVTGRVIPG